VHLSSYLLIFTTEVTQALTHKLERLVFSGKEEDFTYFQDQFEARMYLLRLTDALLDRIKTTPQKDEETEEETRTRTAEEAPRDEQRYKVWCEIIQCLDRKSVMFLRSHKPNGMAAWKALVQQFKSSERPRIHATMGKLTSLRMTTGETITEYLTRAEDLQIDLRDVGEHVSDSMFEAMVLKGLPHEFEGIITVLNHGEKKQYEQMKQELINFSNTRLGDTRHVGGLYSGGKNTPKCFGCGKMGHRQADCRGGQRAQGQGGNGQGYGGNGQGARKETRSCNFCGKVGHLEKDCRQKKKKCGRTNHITAQCWSKQPMKASGNLAHANDDSDMFSFGSFPRMMKTEDIELLIDSGCTGYMLKDRELFVELDRGYNGTVGNADGGQSTIEGRGTAAFWVQDEYNRYRKMELKDAMYVPSYSRNLLSVKTLCDREANVDFGKGARLRTSNGTIFPFSVRDNLYSLQVHAMINDDADTTAYAMAAESLSLWHERLGHNNKRDVAALPRAVEGTSHYAAPAPHRRRRGHPSRRPGAHEQRRN
jgi:hypothetical protein